MLGINSERMFVSNVSKTPYIVVPGQGFPWICFIFARFLFFAVPASCLVLQSAFLPVLNMFTCRFQQFHFSVIIKISCIDLFPFKSHVNSRERFCISIFQNEVILWQMYQETQILQTVV